MASSPKPKTGIKITIKPMTKAEVAKAEKLAKAAKGKTRKG